MILQNIPHELRQLAQWVASGTDKIPLNPRTGQPALVTDPTTWGTFEEAVKCGFRHVGFVLSASDPYTIVDLDDPTTVKVNGIVSLNPDLEQVARIQERHRYILGAFESYAEVSQSGTGIHIIVRGSVPHGVRRDKVEVYSDSRYMICTGNVIKNLPITEQQELVSELFEKMEQGATATVPLVQVASTLTDEELYNMGCRAANADKFNRLWRGEWQGVPEWPSQSEADYALLAMLGFYSLDNEQVRRMFRYSALGKRDKATKNDKYLNYALSKIRAKAPPPVDLSGLLAQGAIFTQPADNTPAESQPLAVVATEQAEPALEATIDGIDGAEVVEFPPGIVGEIADYFFASAIRPVREIALAAAIGITAGVVSRAFNVSGTGLNQYIILLAKTGTGKEGMAKGIDMLLQATRVQVPMIDEYMGPGAFASGQALIRVLDKTPCFVSVLGEFGLTLQQLCHPNANAAQVMLKKVLLDIYAKSGFSNVLRSSVYSDSDKNTKAIQAPNVTILGESNPDTFYTGLDSASIGEGLIPRFSIFEYTGPRPPENENAFQPPPDELVRRFGALAAVAMAAQQNRVCSPVQRDAGAVALFKQFNKHADEQINATLADVNKQLWNRAHLKALKMSALIAVGINPHQPIITEDCAKWTIRLVCRDIEKLLNKFETGEVGTGDVRLELDIRRAITAYLRMTKVERMVYQCPAKMLELQLVPFHYLRRRLRLLVGFKNDRRGATAALNQTLQALVDGEVLVRLNPIQARDACGTNSPVYGLGPAWHG